MSDVVEFVFLSKMLQNEMASNDSGVQSQHFDSNHECESINENFMHILRASILK